MSKRRFFPILRTFKMGGGGIMLLETLMGDQDSVQKVLPHHPEGFLMFFRARRRRVGGLGRASPFRAPAPRPCRGRRPSVVTEGYIRLPPLPPTHPRSTIIPVIYSVFCVRCSKNIVFLQCFVALAVSGFHLGDVKKQWVFHGFGS